MESLYFLVPCALIFIAIAVKVLFWAINNGQYDNLDTEAHRILFDDEKKKSLNSHVTATEKNNLQTPEQKSTQPQHEQDK
ncbi:MAG TPA: cbb3-type cytochrome oxidase assembly protein CcoS [Cellvibrio sp.]|nr:cbb3-type cytochrome oxidase assembly protein CcoS [Cellvibrio sp.]